MSIVFDTNILSTFAKINKLELLVKLFNKQELLIPESVFRELQDSKQEFTQIILDNKNFKRINSTREEKNLLLIIKTSLGVGEKECLTICKNRNHVFITNDEIAIKEAEKQEIEWLNLEIILTALKQENIINEQELNEIIKEIETKDRVKIRNKDKLENAKWEELTRKHKQQ